MQGPSQNEDDLNAMKKNAWIIILFLLTPVMILRLATAAYPLIQMVYLSLTDSHLLKNTNSFIAFKNFQLLFADPDFRSILIFTFFYTIISTVLELTLGLFIALFLNAAFRGRTIARTINLVPWALPPIVAALTFQWLFDDQFGPFSYWIYELTGKHLVITNTVWGAKIALILVNVWKNTPFMAILLLAGLQGVPEELYEAAKVDGAGPVRQFWNITFPMITPLLIVIGMYFIIWQMAGIDLVFGLTRGGPGNATSILSYEMFKEGLYFFKFGYASAIGVVLLGVVGIVGILGVGLYRKYEH